MKNVKNDQTSKTDYMIHDTLLNHLNKRLQVEQKYQKFRNGEGKWSEEDEKERKRLERMKVHILDKHVFRSMANITVFLEYCMHPPLHEVFEDDIEELLLGIRQEHYDKNLDDYSNYENQTVFARFLMAAVSWSQKRHPDSFRLKLFAIMQRVIAFRVLGMAPQILGNKITESVLTADIMRVMALIEFLGRGIKIKTDIPNRPVKF